MERAGREERVVELREIRVRRRLLGEVLVTALVFGQSETVFRAILYHTTGRGNMTLPEKLLYLADYMEPTRDFPEVGQLRRLAYEDLDRAVLMGAELSIREMMERNRVVHPNTLEAEQTLRKGLGL